MRIVQPRCHCGASSTAEYQGLGAYAFTEENTGGQGAYELVNARLGWAQEHVGAYLFAKNLTDTTYFPFAIPGGPGGASSSRRKRRGRSASWVTARF